MILVTGDKGFIGSHLCKRLKELGIEFIGFDIKDGLDIRNKLQLEYVFDSYPITAVIHMAALSGARRGNEYPKEYFDTNVIGSENIARLCEKYKVETMIAFSSASAKSCQNTYGISKRSMELMLKNVPLKKMIVVRPFNVYGENGRQDQVIWKWKSRADAGLPVEYHGDIKRNYTYVGDVVDTVVRLLSSEHNGYVVFDIGNKNKVGLSELLAIFKERYPALVVNTKEIRDFEVEPDDCMGGTTDFISKAKELIR